MLILIIIMFLVIAVINRNELPDQDCRQGRNKRLCWDCNQIHCKDRYFDE